MCQKTRKVKPGKATLRRGFVIREARSGTALRRQRVPMSGSSFKEGELNIPGLAQFTEDVAHGQHPRPI